MEHCKDCLLYIGSIYKHIQINNNIVKRNGYKIMKIKLITCEKYQWYSSKCRYVVYYSNITLFLNNYQPIKITE